MSERDLNIRIADIMALVKGMLHHHVDRSVS
jgi:hypothetical protein